MNTVFLEYTCNSSTSIQVDEMLSDENYVATSFWSDDNRARTSRMSRATSDCFVPGGGWSSDQYIQVR